MNALPQGWTLDAPARGAASALPPGFTRDPKMGLGEDVGRSAVSGLAEGTMGLAGLPADAGSGVQYWGNKVFGEYQPKNADEAEVLNNMIGTPGYGVTWPTTQQIGKGVGYTPYQPQTDLGHVVKSAASLAPTAVGAAVTGGVSALPWALTRAGLAGAAGGEAGNIAAATAGEDARPWGQLAGDILGGYGVAKLGGSVTRAVTRGTAPTASDLKDSSQALFKAGNDAGVYVRSDVIDNIYKDVVQAGWDKGLRENRPGTQQAIGAAKALADEVARIGKNGHASLEDLQTMKEILRDASPEGSAAAGAMIARLGERIDGLRAADIVSGADPKMALNYVNQANALWKQKSKAETIDKVISDAKLVQAPDKPGAYPNALRTGFLKLAKDPNFTKYWTRDEQYAIKTVIAGGGILPALTRLTGTAISTGGVVPGLNLAGWGIRGVGNMARTQAADYASALARSGPQGNPFLTHLPVPRTTRDLSALLVGGTIPFRAP